MTRQYLFRHHTPLAARWPTSTGRIARISGQCLRFTPVNHRSRRLAFSGPLSTKRPGWVIGRRVIVAGIFCACKELEVIGGAGSHRAFAASDAIFFRCSSPKASRRALPPLAASPTGSLGLSPLLPHPRAARTWDRTAVLEGRGSGGHCVTGGLATAIACGLDF